MEERRNAIVFSFFSSFIEKENGVKRARNSYFSPLFSVSFLEKKGEKIKSKASISTLFLPSPQTERKQEKESVLISVSVSPQKGSREKTDRNPYFSSCFFRKKK